MRFFVMLGALLVVVMGGVMPAMASNHRGEYKWIEAEARVILPEMGHAEKVVVDRHRAAILALAKDFEADPMIAKLLAFEAQEFRLAAWGWWPNAMNDDTTPFHPPTHAYLQATNFLLVRMLELAPKDTRVLALDKQLTSDMEATEEAQPLDFVTLCAAGALTFDTATPVQPDWQKLERMAWIGQLLLLVLVAGGMLLFFRSQWRKLPDKRLPMYRN